MNNNWLILEKIIAVVQIVFCLLIICACLYIFIDYYDLTVKAGLSRQNISIFKVIKLFYKFGCHLAILGIVAGILSMNNNAKGWLLSIVIWNSFAIGYSVSILKVHQKSPVELSANIIFWILIFIFFSLGALLTLRPFREKYKPTYKSFLVIITLVILLLFTIIFPI